MTDEVKKKPGRPKGAKDTNKRKKVEQTEAQKANHFKEGNKANVDAWSMRKEARAFKKRCATILLSDQGIEAMMQMWQLTANEGRFREFMEIQRFLAEYAFGRPKEMLETEEQVNVLAQGNLLQQPLFGFIEGSLDEAEETDNEYL